MSARLYEIADYVKSLCDKMKSVENDLFTECEGFAFPQNIAAAISELPPPPKQPFPGR